MPDGSQDITKGNSNRTVRNKLKLNTKRGMSGAADRRKKDFGGDMKRKSFADTKKNGKEKAVRGESGTVSSIVSVGTKTALDQIEGGNEVYDSYIAARSLSRPLESATNAVRHLYHTQAEKAKEKRIKKVQEGKKISRRSAKDSAVKVARETSVTAAKKAAIKKAKSAAETKAGSMAETAAMGTGYFLAGTEAGISEDKKEIKNSTKNRMLRLFITKLGQDQEQDSMGKALKDIVLMHFSMLATQILQYVGLFLLALLALVALMALPVVVTIAVIYNSPFAIFFPSISSSDTAQDVLSGYVAEFNREIDNEMAHYSGYDSSEKVYVDYEGVGKPDNYCDILAVYLVKHGNGDTVTDMTDRAKNKLRSVFDDMCSYTIISETRTEPENGGNAATITVKVVKVKLKTYRDMIGEYSFEEEEQELLAGLMNPECMAAMGHTGGGGNPGEKITQQQYQAVVDAISDVNGKRVVEYALSKIGYLYSQDYRDSGSYYDCSSLAYYAWKNAGINIMYEGSNTAASEGKFCYDNNYLVNFDEMQPGDLIFYSYSKNGRFFNITHVAIYVGDGKVVEAANERLGVVYRSVQGRSSIVFIGRPR